MKGHLTEGAQVGSPNLDSAETSLGLAPEIDAAGPPARDGLTSSKSGNDLGTYLVAARTNRGADRGAVGRPTVLSQGFESLLHDPRRQSAPAGVDHRHRCVGVDDNRNAISGSHRERQADLTGHEGVGVAGSPLAGHLQDNVTVDLIHPGPIIGDPEPTGSLMAQGACGEVAVGDPAEGGPRVGRRRDQGAYPLTNEGISSSSDDEKSDDSNGR